MPWEYLAVKYIFINILTPASFVLCITTVLSKLGPNLLVNMQCTHIQCSTSLELLLPSPFYYVCTYVFSCLCHTLSSLLLYRTYIVHYCTFFCLLTGTNIQTRLEVAIKLECVKTNHPQLHIEAKFYKMMQSGGTYYAWLLPEKHIALKLLSIMRGDCLKSILC